MNAYEYLFSKLKLKFEEQPDSKNLIVKRFELYFDSERICSFNRVRTIKDLFLYLTDPEILFSWWMPEVRPIVKLLQQFPRDLESKEHVDLLLAVNGMNKDEV